MTPPASDAAPIPRRLSRAIVVAGVGGLPLLAVAAKAIPTARPSIFFAASATVWIALAISLWRRRAWDVPVHGGAPASATLSAATWLTLARALGVCALGGLLVAPPLSADPAWPWLPGALYTAIALGDVLDGALARRWGTTSRLGAWLDITTDAIGLVVAPLIAVTRGRLPPWYLLLSFAYPLFQAALRLRARRGLPIHRQRLRPYPAARAWAAAQMTLVAAALFPVLPAALLWPVATVIMLPTLALFAREWRLVTAPSVSPAEAPAEIQHDAGGVRPGAQR